MMQHDSAPGFDIREVSHKVGTAAGLLQTALITNGKSQEETQFFIEESIKRLKAVAAYCNSMLGSEPGQEP